MAIDLTSLVSDILTPQLVSQISASAGVDPAMAQNLVDGAVPAVIGALGSAASKPGGAQKIADAISNADPDTLSKLASSAGASQAMSGGANALSGVLGSSTLWSLSGALGQFAGVPHAAAQSTIGAVTQAVIGVIGQQDPSTWSDPAAIGNLLASQKDIVNAALPAGLSTLLSSSGLLAGMGATAAGAAASVTSAAASAARATSSAAANVASSASNTAGAAMNQARPTPSSSGMPMWLIIVIAIVVLAAIYFYFSSPREPKPAATGAATIEFALSTASTAWL